MQALRHQFLRNTQGLLWRLRLVRSLVAWAGQLSAASMRVVMLTGRAGLSHLLRSQQALRCLSAVVLARCAHRAFGCAALAKANQSPVAPTLGH